MDKVKIENGIYITFGERYDPHSILLQTEHAEDFTQHIEVGDIISVDGLKVHYTGCHFEYGYATLYYRHTKETIKEYIEVLKWI